MFGSLGWSSGPAKLVGWPLQLKSGTAADFTCKLCLKNITQGQSHITLGYYLVQYHFALHPPFNETENIFITFVEETLIFEKASIMVEGYIFEVFPEKFRKIYPVQ